MIGDAITALLLASPAVTAMVGSRVKPQGAPEVQGSAYPHLTWRKVSDIDTSRTNQGRGNVWRARVQVDAWGLTLSQAFQLADEVVSVLDPQRLTNQPFVPLWVMPGCTLHSGAVAQQLDFSEPDVRPQSSPTSRAQRVQTDFHFEYSKT